MHAIAFLNSELSFRFVTLVQKPSMNYLTIFENAQAWFISNQKSNISLNQSNNYQSGQSTSINHNNTTSQGDSLNLQQVQNGVKMTLRSAARTQETLDGHLHFIWNTPESLVFHSHCACHSPVPLSFTAQRFLECKYTVASNCFNSELSICDSFIMPIIEARL